MFYMWKAHLCGKNCAPKERAFISFPSSRVGLRLIATRSLANFYLAIKFGAEKVFDYHSPTCAADIRTYTSGCLAYALDCVSIAEMTELCNKSISRAGGRYVVLEPFPEVTAKSRPIIEPLWILSLSLVGREIAIGGGYGRKASHRTVALMLRLLRLCKGYLIVA